MAEFYMIAYFCTGFFYLLSGSTRWKMERDGKVSSKHHFVQVSTDTIKLGEIQNKMEASNNVQR